MAENESLTEQDLSAGKLEDLEPDELQPLPDPPSRLVGYNQSNRLEPDSSDEMDNGMEELPRPEIASGGNQTEAVNRQNELENAVAQAAENKTKTTN